MSQRTIKAAQNRARTRLQRNKGIYQMSHKSQPEDRTEALSTIKRTTFVRG